MRFAKSRLEDLQQILPDWSAGHLLKYAEEVLIPEGFIHQLTINSNMSYLTASEIYRNHLKEETNKKVATKDAVTVPNLTTRVV